MTEQAKEDAAPGIQDLQRENAAMRETINEQAAIIDNFCVIPAGQTLISGWIPDTSFQRSAAIAEAHEHEMVLNGTHPRYIGYGGEGRALHVEPAPEIPVTAEMIVAGKEAARVIGVAKGSDQLSVVYRAMAAVAPRDTYMSGLPFVAAKDARIAALEAENAELKARSAMLKAEGRGLQRTWDSLCASYRAEIRDLKTENAATRDELAQRLGPLIAADLPDPPRRPDGTLVPQPKPLPMLTTHGPSRRVGG